MSLRYKLFLDKYKVHSLGEKIESRIWCFLTCEFRI
jgi:hypothetical protein